MPARSSTTAPAKGIAGVEAAIKEIEVGLIRPVYLLYGAEAYLRDRFLAALRLIWLGGSGDGYALVREDSKTTQTQLVDAASQISLLPGHRLILVDDPAFVPCGKAQGAEGGVSDSDASSDEASDSDASDSESQGDTEQPGLAQAKAFPDDTRPGSARRPLPSEPDPLLSYIAAPSPEVCIVLLIRRGKPDRRKKLVSEIAKKGALFEAVPLTPQQRIPYLEEELKRLGKTCPPSLLDRISRQSADTAGCIRELEKLAAYAGMESVLTAPMADAVLTPGVEADIFRLVDALGQRKQTQALQELQALFGKGESPFYLFAMMLRQFRIIFRAKACLQDGLSDRQISQALGIHPYSAQKAVSQSRLFTYPVLEKVLARFLDADLAMKSSGAGEHSLILTDLVLALLTYY